MFRVAQLSRGNVAGVWQAVRTMSGGGSSAEANLKLVLSDLGLEALPPVGAPKGSYVLTTRLGNAIHTAGHLPMRSDGSLITGTVGKDLTAEEANKAAEWVGLNLLSTIRAEVGDLDKVVKVHKLVGFVNCTDDFEAQPSVINGCSDLMFKVFGEKGIHARSAVGTNALPLGIAVEIEGIFEVEE